MFITQSKAEPGGKSGWKENNMSYVKIEVGQKFWDESNAREVEVLSFNGSDYRCKTVDGACDDDPGTEGFQWFTKAELSNMKLAR